MTNLYEILEVSERASKEVIEKAYRVLAKKYHPDLQVEEEKQKAESKMKQINEAYEILSDDERRREYDVSLEQEREEQRKREQEYFEEINRNNKETKEANRQIEDIQEEYKNRKQIQNERNRAYAQAYNDYLRSLRL